MRRTVQGCWVLLGLTVNLAVDLTPALAALPKAEPRFRLWRAAIRFWIGRQSSSGSGAAPARPGRGNVAGGRRNCSPWRPPVAPRTQAGRAGGCPPWGNSPASRLAAAHPGGTHPLPGWRLPTLGELTRFQAARSPLFPLPAPFVEGGRPYWTQTRVPDLPPLVYCVDLGDGSMDAHSPGISLGVRWVRQAQPEELERQSPDRQ